MTTGPITLTVGWIRPAHARRRCRSATAQDGSSSVRCPALDLVDFLTNPCPVHRMTVELTSTRRPTRSTSSHRTPRHSPIR